MKKVYIVLILLAIFIAGCAASKVNVPVENKTVEPTTPVVNETPEEPVVEEIPQQLPKVEENLSEEYTVKLGDEVTFNNKKIKVLDINLWSPMVTVSVDGIERDIKKTKSKELINNITITVLSLNNVPETQAVIKAEKFSLGKDEYLMKKGDTVIVNNVSVTLSKVETVTGKVDLYARFYIGEENDIGVEEGQSLVYNNKINITNIMTRQVGTRAEDYVVAKIEKI